MKIKASDLKNEGVKVMISGREIELKLNMNTFCILEELYENPTEVLEQLSKGSFKATRAIVWASYRQVDPQITPEQVGELIDINAMYELSNKIYDLVNGAMPEAEITEDAVGE